MSVTGIQSQIDSVNEEITNTSNKIEETDNLIKEIEQAMENVNLLWERVNADGCKNTFNHVRKNCGLPVVDDTGTVTNGDFQSYWVVKDAAGNPCGDIVSFGNALDGVVSQIDEVSVSMNDVMAKAQEKIEEYKAEIANLESELNALQERMNDLTDQLQAEKIAEAKQYGEKVTNDNVNVDNVF